MLDVDSYLQRIRYAGVRSPTLETLRALHALHPLAIPFENLDTLARVPVKLDLRSLEQKLVHSRRGGYCFEQNLLFKHALGALGFDATSLAARVVWERPAGEVRARTHMVLLVALEERRYVCDVGFGGLTPTAPLELAPGAEQQTPHETFRILRELNEFAVEAQVRGAVEAPLSLRPAGAGASRHRAVESLRHEPCRVADAESAARGARGGRSPLRAR